MRRVLALVLVALAGCGECSAGGDEPQPQPPPSPRFERPAMARFHMRVHFDELRAVERVLVSGDLDGGKELAGALSRPVADPAMAPWIVQTARVVVAARAVTVAPGLDEALRRTARVGEACARCHLATQAVPVFAEPAAAPADDGTPAARMARHAWATDRLWEGLVAGSERPWRSGLSVLAATPLPFSPLSEAPALAAQLRSLASEALVRSRDPREALEDRTRGYGELLVTCAACHARADARPLRARQE